MTEISAANDFETPNATPLWRRIVDFPLVAMVLTILALVAVIALFNLAVKFGLPVDKSTFGKTWRSLVGMALLLVTFKFTNARLGNVRRDDLPTSRSLRDIGLGLVAGTILYSIVIAAAALLHVYWIVGVGDTSDLAKAIVATAIGAAVTEELLFRGVLQRWLEELGGTAFGLAASAILFGLAHAFNPGVTPFAILVITIAGLWLGTAYKLTGSLWYPMGLHAAWNFAQGEIWDVPVSGNPSHGLLDARLSGPSLLTGGPFGLEASVLALVVMAVVAVWQTVLVYRRRDTMPNWWARRRLARSEETIGIDVDRHADLRAPLDPA